MSRSGRGRRIWRVGARVRAARVGASRPAPTHRPLRLCRTSQTLEGADEMRVQEGMSTVVLTVGPGHTLRQAAAQMAERNVGAAVVNDPDGMGPGIVTERDILISLGRGED